MKRILIIQTAFIGDVVLATSLLESVHQKFPTIAIDILVRKGNETLFNAHPFLNEILIWDKKLAKYQNLFRLLFKIRAKHYDAVVNVQRYAATGFLTAFSGANLRIGFDKNPFQFLFNQVIPHQMLADKALHEIERNHQLIQVLGKITMQKPRLYPSPADDSAVLKWKQYAYICIAPSSVWHTKQFPEKKWVEFIQSLPSEWTIYLLGATSDNDLCESILTTAARQNCLNLAGKLSFLQSASLMKNASMNYVNDSAPMHFCSATDAPVTAVYCSTIPGFGYGPLSGVSYIIEVNKPLPCRPCGTHGKKYCPLNHFDCAEKIDNAQLQSTLPPSF